MSIELRRTAARSLLVAALAAGAVFTGRPAAAARILIVGTDAATIQAAIAAASSGDSVFVPPGTYRENLDFLGKAITVRSVDGPGVTTIDGGHAGATVTFATGEGRSSVLEGFTVRGGGTWTGPHGGGVRVSYASPTIRGNRIVLNSADTGGGIDVWYGGPKIEGNEIAFNRTWNYGGGIAVSGSSAMPVEIAGNRLHGNVASSGGGGIYLGYCDTARVAANFVSGNSSYGGGGIEATSVSTLKVVGNLVAANVAETGGGIRCSGARSLLVAHNTVAANAGSEGGAATFLFDPGATDAAIVSNVFAGGEGSGGVSTAPQFDPPADFAFRLNLVSAFNRPAYEGGIGDRTGIDGNLAGGPGDLEATLGDFTPAAGSPAIDAGESSASTPATDVFGAARTADGDGDGTARTDIGAVERRGGAQAFWLDAAHATVTEDAGSVDVTICRIGAGAASVLVATEDAGALGGADYDAISAVVDFAQGESQKTVTVRIRPDGFYEPGPTEALLVTLTPVSAGASLGPRASACVEITDTAALVADYVQLEPGATSRFTAWTGKTVTATLAPKPGRVAGLPTSTVRWSFGETWAMTNDAQGLRVHRLSGRIALPGVGRFRVGITFDPPVVLAAAKCLENPYPRTHGHVTTSAIPGYGPLRAPYSSEVTVTAPAPVTVPAGTFDAIHVSGRLVIGRGAQTLDFDFAPGAGIVRYVFDAGKADAQTYELASTDLGTHSLALDGVVVPSRVRLRKDGKPATARVGVRLANPGSRTEVVTDAAMLDALLAVDVRSLGAVAAPAAVRAGPRRFPIVIPPRRSATVPFDVTVVAANDPARGAGHEDFVVRAALDPAALDRLRRPVPVDPPAPPPPAESALDVVE